MDQPHTQLQTEIVEMARSLVPQFQERAAAYDRENAFPFENYEDLKRRGYHTITVPTRFGGKGAGLYDLCLGQEELAVGDGATALGIGMHLNLIGRVAEDGSWPEDIWTRVCCDVVERGALINSAATEPQMGSPSRGGLPATTARRVEGGWELEGRKTFTTAAPILDYFAVLAAIGDEGRGNFLVPRDVEGVRIEETWDTLGMRATGSHDLVLDHVRLPEDAQIRTRKGGSKDSGGRAWAALPLAAVYIGVARAARDYAANFAKHRVPTALGKPLSKLEHTQEVLGQMDLSIRSARSVLLNTARAWEERPEERADLAPDIAASKYLATNAAIHVTDLAMRLVGGSALSRALPLERLFRDARAGIYNPPSDYETLKLLGQWTLGERPQLG